MGFLPVHNNLREVPGNLPGQGRPPNCEHRTTRDEKDQDKLFDEVALENGSPGGRERASSRGWGRSGGGQPIVEEGANRGQIRLA